MIRIESANVFTRKVLFEKIWKPKIYQPLESGYVFAPYILSATTEIVIDDFAPKSLSKYAVKTVNPNFYYTINLSGI